MNRLVALGGMLTLLAGCNSCPPLPVAAEFAPLESLRESGQAVARLYATPLIIFGGLPTHHWFVIKRADATEFERWEVSIFADQPYGYVYRNLLPPEAPYDFGTVCPYAELIGPGAESVVEFLMTQAPAYPCRDFYLLLPGPNSTSFVRWVLAETGWAVELPPTAIGIELTGLCGGD